jgi:hypothetical protein
MKKYDFVYVPKVISQKKPTFVQIIFLLVNYGRN